MRNSTIRATLCLGTVLVCSSEAAYAYLDPGSLGMYIQLLFGGIAAGIAMAWMYWKRLFFKVKSFFLGSSSPKKETIDSPSDSQGPE